MGGCCACCKSDNVQTKFNNFWEIDNVVDLNGNLVSMKQYKNNVVLVVNVASKCGLTNNQYTQLVQLHQKLQPQGFEILAFPCNQFMWQEPGTNEQCSIFAKNRFSAKFQMFSKVDVNGENAADIFKWLRKNSRLHTQGENASQIGWNFGKFLVYPEGTYATYYGPRFEPRNIEADIEKFLQEKK